MIQRAHAKFGASLDENELHWRAVQRVLHGVEHGETEIHLHIVYSDVKQPAILHFVYRHVHPRC